MGPDKTDSPMEAAVEFVCICSWKLTQVKSVHDFYKTRARPKLPRRNYYVVRFKNELITMETWSVVAEHVVEIPGRTMFVRSPRLDLTFHVMLARRLAYTIHRVLECEFQPLVSESRANIGDHVAS
jgi:hypothetical protein